MSRLLLNKMCLSGFVFAVMLGLWELAARSYASLQFMLPAPSKIVFILWLHADRFALHTFATLQEMAGGFALAFACSFPLAWLMAFYGPLRAILQPMFVAIQCVPMFALAPLMVLWFGWSFTAIIVPTALMIFFPLTINIYQGLCATPRHLLEFFRLHEATAWQTFFKLQLPWALPHIFAGFRIAVALAGIGAVAGEWAGAQKGLGILMLESRRSVDMEMMFGALVCVTALSLLFYGLTAFLEARVEKRQHRKRSAGGLAAVLAVLSLFFSGCQPSEPRARETTIILDWLPNPDHVSLYAGVERGFFAQQGIDLKIYKLADPGDSVPYLSSRQVDLCLTYMPHTLQALAKGAPVVPIGILVQQPLNALIFRSDENIKTPKDLNDKIIGYSVDGYHTKFLEAILDNQQVQPKALQNASFDLVGMLATKHVDVIYGAYWNIESENLRAYGTETEHFPLSDFGVPPYHELIVLAHRQSIEAKPEFIAAFQRALQQSIDFSKEYPKEAFAAYIQANPDKSQNTRQWEWQAWLKTIPTLATHQLIDPALWNQFIDWLIAKQLLDPEARAALVMPLIYSGS